MSKAIIVLIAIIGLASTLHMQIKDPQDFESYKIKFGFKFENEHEHKYRMTLFLANLDKIRAHNSDKSKTYQIGINQFSHLTQDQFAQTYLKTFVRNTNDISKTSHTKHTTYAKHLGVNVDWVAAGAVTPVKNQGHCGSCWSFSTTGSLQGLSKIAYGTLQSFSEQNLVDCAGAYGNRGCNGGWVDNAFKYVKDHGITTEAAYPYNAVQGNCTVTSTAFQISGYTDVPGCDALANALVGRPISIIIDAKKWQHYKLGIFNDCDTVLGHGVLLVGMTDQYWLVKNSWGTTWGEAGYIRLARGNTCGICNAASYPNK